MYLHTEADSFESDTSKAKLSAILKMFPFETSVISKLAPAQPITVLFLASLSNSNNGKELYLRGSNP
jgi:hypothetical protein